MMTPAGNGILGSVMILLCVATAARAGVEVRLRERAEVRSSVVRLDDVAELSGDNATAQRLRSLPLMPAPALGSSRFMQPREVADLLESQGVDLRDIRFVGTAMLEIVAASDGWKASPSPDAEIVSLAKPANRHAAVLAGREANRSMRVRRDDQDETHMRELRSVLDRLIETYLAEKVDPTAIWQSTCELNERHAVLKCGDEKSLVCQGGHAPWNGRQRFIVTCQSAEGPVQFAVYSVVSVKSGPVAVAIRPIPRGNTLTAADLEMRTLDYLPTSNERRTPTASLDELIGMEARHAIRADEVIYGDHVQAPVLIKRGELVSVVSHAGGIRVRTTAKARENGARGELVQLESLETRERFDARVTGVREAAVFALSRTETARRPIMFK